MTIRPALTAMPLDSSALVAATNGLRILSIVLAAAILVWWAPSVWRVLRGATLRGDAHRAGVVPFAIAVVVFEMRWFWPHLEPLTRSRLALVGHAGMAMAMMFAIYLNGHRVGTACLRRVFIVHVGMLALCIGASSVLR